MFSISQFESIVTSSEDYEANEEGIENKIKIIMRGSHTLFNNYTIRPR